MSLMTIFATLALAMPTNESGPVWSAITPTLMDESLDESPMALSFSCRAAMAGHASQSAVVLPPAHGEDSLGGRIFVLDQPALEGEEGRPGPGGDADLRVQALD